MSSGSLGAGSTSQFTIDASGDVVTSGSVLTTGTLEGGNTTVDGTFTATGGLSTLDSLTVNNATNLNGTLGVTGAEGVGGALSVAGKITTSTSAVNIGSTLVASGSSSPLLTVGKVVANAAPFMVDQAGNVTAAGSVTAGNFNGISQR